MASWSFAASMPAAWALACCQAPPGSGHDTAAFAAPPAAAQTAAVTTAVAAPRSTPPLWRRGAPHSTLVLGAGLDIRRGVQGVEPECPPEQGLGPGRQRRLELERGAERAGHEHLVARALHRVRDRRPHLGGLDPLASARGPGAGREGGGHHVRVDAGDGYPPWGELGADRLG